MSAQTTAGWEALRSRGALARRPAPVLVFAQEEAAGAAATEDPWVQVTAGCDVPAEVLSLARAADKSHVFGGMGSWNDMPLESETRERLWEAMHGGWGAVFAALTACVDGASS